MLTTKIQHDSISRLKKIEGQVRGSTSYIFCISRAQDLFKPPGLSDGKAGHSPAYYLTFRKLGINDKLSCQEIQNEEDNRRK